MLLALTLHHLKKVVEDEELVPTEDGISSIGANTRGLMKAQAKRSWLSSHG
jgi:hypothetical protein